MAHLLKVILILTLSFLAVDARHRKRKSKIHKVGKIPGIPKLFPTLPEFPPLPKFPPFLPFPLKPVPFPYEQKPPGVEENNGYFNNKGNGNANNFPNQEEAKPDFDIDSIGHWDLINQDSGVSAMHINLLPTNKIIVFDSKIYRPSRLNLPDGMPCVPFKDDKTKEDKQDCYAHAMEYDIETNEIRPLRIAAGDPWCSSGGLAPDGTFVGAGGFFDGGKTLRYIGGGDCQDCEWREYNNVLAEDRWYASQQLLPNGDFFLIGGRRAFSYEFLPLEGQKSNKPYFFPFLYETSDLDENNLYPFVHLSTDGNLFIFSNNRSLLLNPTTNRVVRTFPVLPGGSRNYPASGMSALLPLDLNAAATDATGTTTITAEVIICGGNAPNAFELAETKKIFIPALQDCNRLTITDRKPKWDNELMPSGRTMGDSLVLPNGQLLFINGAQKGTAAWWDADEPNYTPVLYSPEKPKGLRFKVLKPSQIARMYHSSSAVLPSGKVWVGGSNTHNAYKDVDKFPTETRVEAFSPPYLDMDFDEYRPQIDEFASVKDLRYGDFFEMQFSVEDGADLTKNDIKVTMYFPPFTTHGVSMGQRLVVLKNDGIIPVFGGAYRIRLVAPPSAVIAPPGYYLLFVVHRGLPSKGIWVQLQ